METETELETRSELKRVEVAERFNVPVESVVWVEPCVGYSVVCLNFLGSATVISQKVAHRKITEGLLKGVRLGLIEPVAQTRTGSDYLYLVKI